MVENVHERRLPRSSAVGDLLDTLATPADRLWPWERWPAMSFDPDVRVGAAGGHGPIRYTIDTYVPGRHIRFRFLKPTGFDGYHEFCVVPATEDQVVLRHSLVMRARGWALLSWPVVVRPLHDALIEDALHKAAGEVGQDEHPPRWSPWVRLLRRAARRRQRTVGRQALETP